MTSPCQICGRELLFDASVQRWVHSVEPTPDGHPARPTRGAKKVACPKCNHPFVVIYEVPA